MFGHFTTLCMRGLKNQKKKKDLRHTCTDKEALVQIPHLVNWA